MYDLKIDYTFSLNYFSYGLWVDEESDEGSLRCKTKGTSVGKLFYTKCKIESVHEILVFASLSTIVICC